MREAVAGLPHVRHILVQGGTDDRAGHAARVQRSTRSSNTRRATSLPQIDGSDVAVMLYSSGTTGRPKGVLLSHANLLASSAAVADAAELDTLGRPANHASAPCRSRTSSAWRS